MSATAREWRRFRKEEPANASSLGKGRKIKIPGEHKVRQAEEQKEYKFLKEAEDDDEEKE